MHRIIKKIKDSDIATRIASGAFWSLTGTAIAKFIVLIAGIFCAHILGQEEYGEFGMVRSTINLFVVFGAAGLGITASKYISEYRKTQQAKVCKVYKITNKFAIITGFFVTTLIIILAPYIATNSLEASHLASPIRIGALLLFVTVLNGAQSGCLSGFEDFKSIALNTLYGSIAESILMLLGASLYGVAGAIMGYGCGFIVLYLLNYISIQKNFKIHNIVKENTKIFKDDLKIVYKFTLPAAFSSFLVMPIYWIIRTLLVQKDGFEELAIYEAADQWKVIILFIPSAITNIILPILSSATASKNNNIWKIIKVNLLINTSVATILALIIVALSPYIMYTYGKEYDNPFPLIILALSTIPTSIANVVGVSIASRAKMWTGFSFNILWAIMMVLFTYILLEHGYGASALALSTFLSYIIHSFIQFIYLKHEICKI